jgi:hypothetical protein
MVPAEAFTVVTGSRTTIPQHHNLHATTTLLKSSENEVEGNNSDREISVIDVANPTPGTRKEIVMSPAIPFLECPAVLVDYEMAGNVGFDPLGLARTEEDLINYREAEVRHGRLAMLVGVCG